MTKKRRRRLHSIIRALHCMFPNRRELPPERLTVGGFTVELHRVRHTQVAGYGKSTVDAMIISAEGKSVYVASDSAPAGIAARVCAAWTKNGRGVLERGDASL